MQLSVVTDPTTREHLLHRRDEGMILVRTACEMMKAQIASATKADDEEPVPVGSQCQSRGDEGPPQKPAIKELNSKQRKASRKKDQNRANKAKDSEHGAGLSKGG